MGGWGTITSGFKGTPKAPPFRNYQSDPYFDPGGVGTAHGQNSDQAAYTALMAYMDREPGYSADEKKAMYDQPADQSKMQEQVALRRLSQGAAGAGSFGAGSTTAGKGAIIGGGISSRADLRRTTLVQAAEAAMQDRIRQIQAATDYSSSRLGMTTQNREGANAFNMGLNTLDQDRWKARLAQYNFDRQKNREMVGKIVSSVGGGCWVAEAIFGVDSIQTHFARFYVNNLAPKNFHDWYMANGQALATKVDNDPKLKEILRPLFVAFAEDASRRLGGHLGRIHTGHTERSTATAAID